MTIAEAKNLHNTDSSKIERIIHSLKNHALADIKGNADKPIAGFILAACFIDQISGFLYNTDAIKSRFNRFVKDYMPKYNSIQLYESLRNKLVHNYSIGGFYRITSDQKILHEANYSENLNIINLWVFIEDLESAFEKVCQKFRSIGQARTNALEWFAKGNQGISSITLNFISCNEAETDFLIEFYKPLILDKEIGNRNELIVTDLFRQEFNETEFVLKIKLIEKKGKSESVAYLEDAVNHLKLILPMDALKQMPTNNGQ